MRTKAEDAAAPMLRCTRGMCRSIYSGSRYLAGNHLLYQGLDRVAEGGEMPDEARRPVALGPAVEVVGAEILEEGAVWEHVVGGGQDGGGDGADRLFRAAAGAQALELGLEVAALLARRRPGALHEGGLQPGRAVAQAGGAALARALVATRAQARPGQQVPGGGEAAHVGADLGHDHLGTERADAGDGDQQPDRGAKGLEVRFHLSVDLGDRGLQGVDLAQVEPQQEAVVGRDAPT